MTQYLVQISTDDIPEEIELEASSEEAALDQARRLICAHLVLRAQPLPAEPFPQVTR